MNRVQIFAIMLASLISFNLVFYLLDIPYAPQVIATSIAILPYVICYILYTFVRHKDDMLKDKISEENEDNLSPKDFEEFIHNKSKNSNFNKRKELLRIQVELKSLIQSYTEELLARPKKKKLIHELLDLLFDTSNAVSVHLSKDEITDDIIPILEDFKKRSKKLNNLIGD